MIKLKRNKHRPEPSLGSLFWQTTHAWQRQLNEALKPLDLTHMQFILLAGLHWLSSKHETVTQAKLAAHANIDVMMASNVIRTLIKKQHIQRDKHPTDTRAHQLILTESGTQTIEKAIDIAEALEKDFFTSMESEVPDMHKSMLKLLINKK